MELLTKAMNEHFKKMTQSHKPLYRVNCTGDELWSKYLEGFQPDPVFRDPNSSEHNCNMCKHFITHYGNIVSLNDDNTFTSIFDFEMPQLAKEEYEKSILAMRELIRKSEVDNLFVVTRDSIARSNYDACPISNYQHLGLSKNVKRYTKEEADKFGVVKPNQIVVFDHMYLAIPAVYIKNTHDSIATITTKEKAKKDSLEKSLNEFTVETIELVIDLIEQQSILNGESQLEKLRAFSELSKKYSQIPEEQRNVWLWKQIQTFQYCHIRGEVIGTLLTDIQSGVDIAEACRAWNKKVDPANYMKAQAPITKTQIKNAQEFTEQNGYTESFTRRCATMADIEASEILHIHNGEVKPVSIFDAVKTTETSINPDRFKGLKEISIEAFMQEILPNCTSLEAYFNNKHKNNLVTLITANDKDSKPIFKWKNNFSWTYTGNLAGKSLIAKAVKNAGGFVDAPFRFSIMWNEDGRSIVDLDAHVVEPDGTEISYCAKRSRKTLGQLDVDMIRPRSVGVENIYWEDMSKLIDGRYRFFVHNFDSGNTTGVKAEIAIDGNVYTYQVNENFRGEKDIAYITIKNGHMVSVEHRVPVVDSVGDKVYNITTGQFHQVNLVCLSPNYWGDNVGNKHYFFFLEGCKSPEKLRGFHNEFLNSDLTPHRKVLDVLAHTMQVESTDGQLSGLGFNSTIPDELIVRYQGKQKGIIKIKF